MMKNWSSLPRPHEPPHGKPDERKAAEPHQGLLPPAEAVLDDLLGDLHGVWDAVAAVDDDGVRPPAVSVAGVDGDLLHPLGVARRPLVYVNAVVYVDGVHPLHEADAVLIADGLHGNVLCSLASNKQQARQQP